MNRNVLEKFMAKNPGCYITNRGVEIKNRKGQTEILVGQRGLIEMFSEDVHSVTTYIPLTDTNGNVVAPNGSLQTRYGTLTINDGVVSLDAGDGTPPTDKPETTSTTYTPTVVTSTPEELAEAKLNLAIEQVSENKEENEAPKLDVENTPEKANDAPDKPKRGRKPKTATP